MAIEIFLIADANGNTDETAASLRSVLDTTPASALLIAAGEEDDDTYLGRVGPLAAIAQSDGVAVLLDNRPHLVARAGADGVHMSGGIKALREAIGQLKPDFIVGTGRIGSRHEAMVRGELEVDYLMFADNGDPHEGLEMADWWAQTFEVPSVYLTDGGRNGPPNGVATEFLAYRQADWPELAAGFGSNPKASRKAAPKSAT